MDLNELNIEDTHALIAKDPRKWIDAFLESHGSPDVEDLKYGCDREAVNGFSIKSVHEEGDTEGGGEHSEVVFAIVNSVGTHLAYFKYSGCYTSHYGTEWDDEYEIVYPREVTYTEYYNTQV